MYIYEPSPRIKGVFEKKKNSEIELGLESQQLFGLIDKKHLCDCNN